MAKQKSSTESGEPLMVGTKFKVLKKLGAGAFGEFRLGKNLETGEEVGVKLEDKNAPTPVLFLEYHFYKVLQNGTGVPQLHYFGDVGRYHALVMDLLGRNLEDLFDACERKFSEKTTIQIAIQLISRIEFLHSKNILHRDIKPENFLITRPGSGKKENLIHVIDFGLAKEYIDPTTKKHIPFVTGKSMTGTARYMSINVHKRYEQSRRDDLEALGHIFFYFLKGSLPWQGMKGKDMREKYENIAKVKEQTAIDEICRGCPREFGIYLTYVRGMDFYQQPDYKYLKDLFVQLFKRNHYEYNNTYDWNTTDRKGTSLKTKENSSKMKI